MQLIAHATMFEFAAGIVVFLAGMCVGPCLAYLIFKKKAAAISSSVLNAPHDSPRGRPGASN
jgi:hypothetical protein